jgi:GTP cyclohydrolase I
MQRHRSRPENELFLHVLIVYVSWRNHHCVMTVAQQISHFTDQVVETAEVIPSEVEEAIRTLLRWAGDDPGREGLIDTPKRVARAWREYCRGYHEDPAVHLERTFEDAGGYDEIVLLSDVQFHSHCEHHMAPIVGRAHIAYLPHNRVVGISKVARVLHGYARRLQIQERLAAQVADCIWTHLKPRGVAVVLQATHGCMTSRGVGTAGVVMTTSRMMGVFREDAASRREVLSLMRI